MSGVLDRLRKKRGYPVTIDGETYHVRSLTLGELRRLESIPQENKTGFVVGCALCSGEAGEPEFQKNAATDSETEETDTAWAARIMAELSDVPTETLRALSQGAADLGKTPKAEAVVKN